MTKLIVKVIANPTKKQGSINYEIAELKNEMLNLMESADVEISSINNTLVATYTFESISETKTTYILDELNKSLPTKSKTITVIAGEGLIMNKNSDEMVVLNKKWELN